MILEEIAASINLSKCAEGLIRGRKLSLNTCHTVPREWSTCVA